MQWLIKPGFDLSYVGPLEGDGMFEDSQQNMNWQGSMLEDSQQNINWQGSMTWDAIDELHGVENDLVNSKVVNVCFDAKREFTCGSSIQNNFDVESDLHSESDLMYDGDVSSFDESDISILSTWDEVESPVGGDVVVGSDPIFMYATACGLGSMFSREDVKEILHEKEIPSALDDVSNVCMDPALQVAISEDTYACVDEICVEDEITSEFFAMYEGDSSLIEDACIQSNVLKLQNHDSIDASFEEKVGECNGSLQLRDVCNDDTLLCMKQANSMNEHHVEDDLSFEANWGGPYR